MAEGRSDDAAREDPTARLEKAFIAEFLERRGVSPAALHELPAHEAEALLKEASTYASGKLTEVESRAHLAHELHHVTDPTAS